MRALWRAVLVLGVILSLAFAASAQAECVVPPSGHWSGTFAGSLSGTWESMVTFTVTEPVSATAEISGSVTTTGTPEAGTLSGIVECGVAHESILYHPSGIVEEVTGTLTHNTEAFGDWEVGVLGSSGTWNGSIYAAGESEGTQPGVVELRNPPGSEASSLSIEPVNPALLPAGVVAPAGAVSFSLGEVAHAGTIDVTLELPAGSEPTAVYKWTGSEYRLYPAEKVKISGNEITLELTDNEAPWDEDPALGVIRDPVVPVHAQPGTPPTVGKIAPSHGHAEGGKTVKITGTGFTGVTRVKFGSADATSVTVNSPTSLTATSPAGINGTVDVAVWNASGGSPTSSADQFRYEGPVITNLNPDFGSTGGGTTITVRGAGFEPGATAFKFGTVAAASVSCASTSACTVVAPAAKKSKAGAVDVTVTAGAKKSKKRPPADQFTYN
jgi:large repetitive protein